MAYSTALRQSMLSNGATVGLIEVYQSRGAARVVRVRLEVGSSSNAARAAGCDAGARDVDVEVAGDQPVVDVVGVDIQRDLDTVRQRLAVRVGRLVPLVLRTR